MLGVDAEAVACSLKISLPDSATSSGEDDSEICTRLEATKVLLLGYVLILCHQGSQVLPTHLWPWVMGADTRVGATEIVLSFLPSSFSSASKAEIMSSVNQVQSVMNCSESLSVYDGWVPETAVSNLGLTADEGETSRVYLSVVGGPMMRCMCVSKLARISSRMFIISWV